MIQKSIKLPSKSFTLLRPVILTECTSPGAFDDFENFENVCIFKRCVFYTYTSYTLHVFAWIFRINKLFIATALSNVKWMFGSAKFATSTWNLQDYNYYHVGCRLSNKKCLKMSTNKKYVFTLRDATTCFSVHLVPAIAESLYLFFFLYLSKSLTLDPIFYQLIKWQYIV